MIHPKARPGFAGSFAPSRVISYASPSVPEPALESSPRSAIYQVLRATDSGTRLGSATLTLPVRR